MTFCLWGDMICFQKFHLFTHTEPDRVFWSRSVQYSWKYLMSCMLTCWSIQQHIVVNVKQNVSHFLQFSQDLLTLWHIFSLQDIKYSAFTRRLLCYSTTAYYFRLFDHKHMYFVNTNLSDGFAISQDKKGKEWGNSSKSLLCARALVSDEKLIVENNDGGSARGWCRCC